MTEYLEVWCHTVTPHGTLGIGEGYHRGDAVTFAGDHRAMARVAEAIESTGEPVVVAVPPGMILERRAAIVVTVPEHHELFG